MNKSLLFLLVHVSLLAISTARPNPRNLASFGPWIDQNVYDPKVQYMASYAISEYDKNTGSHLELIEVVSASTFYVSFYPRGQNIWHLVLKAKDCSQPSTPPSIYQSQVYENFNPPQFGGNYLSFGFLMN
ncbi:Cysteine proteinase inhibitor [Rhynchospora pubera]|uniref:Cysteine proteinase inhibitor n=1 Tax=Rhynchospora pubera TaxID=906938 RepID=A0AAV8E248_9POAL|nr:Cysteine proteinase inhibitor [Rhynchospora pubera]